MELKDRNVKYWNEGSEIYSEIIVDELENFKKEAWKGLIRKNMGEKQSLKVLDVGTGPGFFAIIMSQMGYNVTAIDSSEMMINKAKANAKLSGVNVNFMICDIDASNFQEETFDAIISRNVTWTLQDPVKVYRLWHKLLKKDGKVLIFDANWNSRLVNPKIQKQYEKDLETAKNMGHYIEIGDDLESEGDNISLKLPLTYEIRPEWDKKVISDIGFRDVVIDKKVDEIVCTEAEKIANSTTPMFSICAVK